MSSYRELTIHTSLGSGSEHSRTRVIIPEPHGEEIEDDASAISSDPEVPHGDEDSEGARSDSDEGIPSDADADAILVAEVSYILLIIHWTHT